MSIQLEVENDALTNIMKQFDILKQNAPRSMYSSLMKVAFKIRSEAMNRLKGRRHVVSSRLRNSIHVQGEGANIGDNKETYSDDNGKSYSSILATATFAKGEIGVGSNVEYASSIELGSRKHKIPNAFGKGVEVDHPGYAGDSFLYWAMQHVDVTKSTGDDMKKNFENIMKFGGFK